MHCWSSHLPFNELEEWLTKLDTMAVHVIICIALRSYGSYNELISAKEIQHITSLETDDLFSTLDYLLEREYIAECKAGQFSIAGMWHEPKPAPERPIRIFPKEREVGESASSSLRHQIMYKFQGRCAACGVEEWQTQKRLHLHRPLKGKNVGALRS
jgi:hypothetical protein